MKKAIILFVRHPELGKVKTRLASEIGALEALDIYQQLLRHTHAITYPLDCDKFVFYADAVMENDIWENEIYYKRKQCGVDLGERMQEAFNQLFQKGYEKVVIIGSDCPGLNSETIETAFDLLDANHAVLGPASDGGYYLLALKEMREDLFHNKIWSAEKVLQDTINDLNSAGLNYFLLPVLSDVDTKNDLVHLIDPLTQKLAE